VSTIPNTKSTETAIAIMTAPASNVGGADTHADTIHVALITSIGQALADAEFPTTSQGYRDAVVFLTSHGPIDQVGIEGTSSYGAGFSRVVAAAGIGVIEINRTNRAARRRHGKSDPLDAYQAARAVLSGDASSAPKNASVDAIRSLHNTRRSGVKARTATMNQITAMLVTAPDPIRSKYRALQAQSLVTALTRCRPTTTDPLNLAVLTALKTLAERHQFLTAQNNELTTMIDTLVTEANPALRSAYGVGPDTGAQLLITAGANPDRLRSEAAFAALCGACPVPASSGKTTRHRLSRGGDRNANNALYRIALVRMSSHPRTREYVARQVAAGRSKPEIIRLLKRAIAREIFRLLTNTVAVPEYADLRATRQSKNITMTAAANAFSVWPTRISRIELGLNRDDAFADLYREWLTAA
jgi:transposase